VVDVSDVAEEEHGGRQDDQGDEGRVVQCAVECARLFAIACIVGRRGVAGEHVGLRDEASEDDAVCAEEEDGVQGDE
jgi:hypothetical protein